MTSPDVNWWIVICTQYCHLHTSLSVSWYLIIFYIYSFVIAAHVTMFYLFAHPPPPPPPGTVMLILIFNSTAYCHAHSLILYILYSVFYILFFIHFIVCILPLLYSTIFALSMERTWLTFHCWLYNLCIVVYVTNKTWNLKLETWCGLSWCFYQLFGLSFWRHPFTAEHPLLRHWCSETFLQTWWRNKLILILDGL